MGVKKARIAAQQLEILALELSGEADDIKSKHSFITPQLTWNRKKIISVHFMETRSLRTVRSK